MYISIYRLINITDKMRNGSSFWVEMIRSDDMNPSWPQTFYYSIAMMMSVLWLWMKKHPSDPHHAVPNLPVLRSSSLAMSGSQRLNCSREVRPKLVILHYFPLLSYYYHLLLLQQRQPLALLVAQLRQPLPSVY